MIGTREIEIGRGGLHHLTEVGLTNRENVTNEETAAAIPGTEGGSMVHQRVAGHEDEVTTLTKCIFRFYFCFIIPELSMV
jgi:hypothetical protein